VYHNKWRAYIDFPGIFLLF